MAGTSQGTSYPEFRPHPSLSLALGMSRVGAHCRIEPTTHADEWHAAVASSVACVARIGALTQQLNASTNQRGCSWALPVQPAVQASTPTWTSRQEWLRQFKHHTTTPAGKRLCARHLIKPEKAYAVAQAHSYFADARTGRGVTAAKARIAARAEVSISTVNRGRRVLLDLKMGIEHARGRTLRTLEFLAAEAHHGGQQHRAASTWSLSSPRSVVETTPRKPRKGSSYLQSAPVVRFTHSRRSHPGEQHECKRPPRAGIPDTLSGGGCFSFDVLPLGRTYQHARGREQCDTHKKNQKLRTHTPRPIALQRAAAELVKRAPALDPSGHIGVVCDLIQQACIDTKRWNGQDIASALSRDTAQRGLVWPTKSSLVSPMAYLRYRLAAIDWTQESPSEQRKAYDQVRQKDSELLAQSHKKRQEMSANPEHREKMLAIIRSHLSSRVGTALTG